MKVDLVPLRKSLHKNKYLCHLHKSLQDIKPRIELSRASRPLFLVLLLIQPINSRLRVPCYPSFYEILVITSSIPSALAELTEA